MKLVRVLAAATAIVTALGVALIEPASVQAQAKGKVYAAKGTGTIKGKVTLDGEPPAPSKIKIDPNNKDAGHCGKGDTEDQTWVIGKDKGLGNVVVFLKPPAGQYFKVDLSKKNWQDEVVIDQPYCAFKPHVSIIFPESEGKRTGQKVTIKNSAPILHNSRFAGSSFKNPAKNYTLASGKEQPIEPKADNQAIILSCDAHKWMEAFIWAFDHPYAAVTDADGNFEIKDVPLGADISVMAWHESDGKAAQGKEVQKGVKDGDNVVFKIKKK